MAKVSFASFVAQYERSLFTLLTSAKQSLYAILTQQRRSYTDKDKLRDWLETRSAYIPLFITSSSWEPSSATRPLSMTIICLAACKSTLITESYAVSHSFKQAQAANSSPRMSSKQAAGSSFANLFIDMLSANSRKDTKALKLWPLFSVLECS